MKGVRFPHLGTGTKMLLILTVALLPLGLIALFASLESVQTNHLRREAEARQIAVIGARQLSGQIARLSFALRGATDDLSSGSDPASRAACRDAIDGLALAQRFMIEFAVFTNAGRRLCATPGFSAAAPRAPTMVFATEVRIEPSANALRFEARDPGARLFAVGELGTATLADMARPTSLAGNRGLALLAADARLVLVAPPHRPAIGRMLRVSSPVAGGQVMLETGVGEFTISAVEVVMALLPLLMWLAAALIGWLVVDRLLVRPLLQMQHAIDHYRPGEPLVLPHLTTPAQELRDLGRAFQAVTDTLAAHERDLQAGLARQIRLTREVHHRVKNNLQVVASLINLHSRGVDDPAVARAYASIQRRVDALAVVHRNHFAEMEDNRGLALRGLLGELAQNLRGSAPPEAARVAITLDIMPAAVSQDVAVPVAFLVTELVELAMTNDPAGRIAIRLAPGEDPLHASLSVIAPGLTDRAMGEGAVRERAERVILGLSRQLRAPLERDEDTGCYAVRIAVLPQSDASAADKPQGG